MKNAVFVGDHLRRMTEKKPVLDRRPEGFHVGHIRKERIEMRTECFEMPVS